MFSPELEPSDSDERFARVTFTLPKEIRDAIDAAAAQAGETRSNYLVQAALQRMGQLPMTLTSADLSAIAELVRLAKK